MDTPLNNQEKVASNQPEKQPTAEVNLEKQNVSSVENATQGVGTSVVAQQTATPKVQPVAPVASSVHTSSVQARALANISQLPAEDTDLIEKPWVEAVEGVIDETKDDPRLEDDAQRELSKTYLKKRFNVDVE